MTTQQKAGASAPVKERLTDTITKLRQKQIIAANKVAAIIQSKIDTNQPINTMQRKWICSHRVGTTCDDSSYEFRLKCIIETIRKKQLEEKITGNQVSVILEV